MPEVRNAISAEVQKYNKLFGAYEQIKKYELVTDDWTVGNGILTPTLKVKRAVIQKRYQQLIDSMFV